MARSSPVGFGPIPLVFSVTGHRDLVGEDIPRLEAGVRQVFQAMQTRYPHSPLRLLSPLAEGADHLAARVALELGGELVAPLPLPPQDYARDFVTIESRQEFERLLKRASQVFVLPAVSGSNSTIPASNLSERERQYEEAGSYAVRHSHFLIALWDGENLELPGGTASIVMFKVLGVPGKRLNPLDVPDLGILFHIPARRQRDSQSYVGDYNQFCKQAWIKAEGQLGGIWEHQTGVYATCSPEAVSLKGFERIISRMDEFNRRTTEATGREENSVKDPAAFDQADASIRAAYQYADFLAVSFRASYRHALIAIYCTAAATGLSFGVLNLPGWDAPSLALVYAVLFLATAAAFQLQKKKGWFDDYLEYRALAEGLRVQRFWQIAGLGYGADRVEAFDLYLRKQVGEIGWVRESLRALSCHEPVSSDHPARQFIYKYWVKEQADYFNATAERDRLKLRRFRRIASAFYWTGLIAALTIRGLTYASINVLGADRSLNLALRLLLVAPAFGALVSSYSRHLVLDEQEKAYRLMAELFSNGKRQIEALGPAPNLLYYEAILRALGSEALRENADWLHLHSTHPVESPYTIPRISLRWWRKREVA
jgi:hypothetical protein